MELYRVKNSFSIYEDDEQNQCKPAAGQITSFKPGDIVQGEKSAQFVRLFYKCEGLFGGNVGVFGGAQSGNALAQDLTLVKKCDGYSNYDEMDNGECISPFAVVIDNGTSGSKLKDFLAKPFGMNPWLGWSITGVALAGATYGIVKLAKK